MKCNNCGTELEAYAISCPKCGAMAFGNHRNHEENTQKQREVKRGAGDGSASLICGVLALVFDILSCIDYLFAVVSVSCGLLGLILGIVGKGNPKADTGKILSIIALCLLAICMIIASVLKERYFGWLW